MALSVPNVVKVTGSNVTSVTTSGVTTTTGSSFYYSSTADAGVTINTPTDSKSNSATIVGASQATANNRQSVFRKDNGAGGAGHTATFTYSGATYPTAFFIEVAGAAAASFDSGSVAQASDSDGTPHPVTSGTLAQADTMLLSFCAGDGGGTQSYSATGFTVSQETDGNSFWTGATGYELVAATTAVTASWVNSSTSGLMTIVGVKGATGGSGGITGAGQIASGETIGSAAVGAGISPAGIASAQAFGSAVIGAGINTTGIATAEALGTPSIAAGIAPAGVASGEAIGAPAIAAAISTTGIASAEAFGLPVVAPAGVIAVGIPSAEAFGAPRLDASISATGIGSAEAFGATMIAAGVAPIGIATGEALGVPNIAAGIAPAAIPGGEAFGAASLAASIQAAGIASGEAFGAPTVQSSGVFPIGIDSAEAFGQPALAAAITATGIVSGEAFGNPLVGDAPPPPAIVSEFDIVAGTPRRQRIPERNFKPLLQRVLEAKYPRVKPAKERARRRAKAIEQRAAQLVADQPQNEARFTALMREWQQERPMVPPGADLESIFAAQVAFRMRQLELVQVARAALARERDEEDAIAVLLLLS